MKNPIGSLLFEYELGSIFVAKTINAERTRDLLIHIPYSWDHKMEDRLRRADIDIPRWPEKYYPDGMDKAFKYYPVETETYVFRCFIGFVSVIKANIVDPIEMSNKNKEIVVKNHQRFDVPISWMKGKGFNNFKVQARLLYELALTERDKKLIMEKSDRIKME